LSSSKSIRIKPIAGQKLLQNFNTLDLNLSELNILHVLTNRQVKPIANLNQLLMENYFSLKNLLPCLKPTARD